MANPNFDSLLTTTLNNYRKTFEDNIFSARPFVYWLKRKDKIRLINGGAKIVVPIIYAKNATSGSYSGYDTIDTTPTDSLTSAEFPWGQYAASVAINGLEEAQNNGDAAILNLLESKVQVAEESVAENMDSMFFLDGSGNSNKDWWGLAAVVSTSNPSRGNFGNIDRSTDTYWQAFQDTTTTTLTIADMANLYNSVSRGNDHPDYSLTTQTLFQKYESLLQPQLRLTDTKSGDAGFQNLLYKDMPLFFDTYCQASTLYALNSKYLQLVGHADKWFTNTPFKQPMDQDARYSQIIAYGQLTCSRPAGQGKLTNRS